MTKENIEIPPSYHYNYQEMTSSTPQNAFEQYINPSDIPNLLPRQEYLHPVTAARPLEVTIDPKIYNQYLCLEDWKDPEKILIKDKGGNALEERVYFSAGTVSGKEGEVLSETWQIGLLIRKEGEKSFSLQPPITLKGGTVLRECAPTVWVSETKKNISMLVHSDCFSPGAKIEYFESNVTDGTHFTFVNTTMEGKENIGQYDPQIFFINNQEHMAYVRYDITKTKENNIRFTQLFTNDQGEKTATDLGIYLAQQDIPHQCQIDDPESSIVGYLPQGYDPEYEWGPEAPWFEERTLENGTEVIDGYIVTFRKRIGFDEHDNIEVRKRGTRQRLTHIRISKNNWNKAIKNARLEREQAKFEKRNPSLIKIPFDILGYVIDPGSNAECGHGSDHIFQKRTINEDGTLGKWQLYELVDEED